MRKRFSLSNEAFNDLVRMTDSLKLDWFYPEYFKRKTIDVEDVRDILDSWEESWNE